MKKTAYAENIRQAATRLWQEAQRLDEEWCRGALPAALTAPLPSAERRTFLADLLRAFITPIEREDLWLLYESLEEVSRALERARCLRFGHRVTLPTEEVRALTRRLVQGCERLQEASRQLTSLAHPLRVLTPLEAVDRLVAEGEQAAALTENALIGVAERQAWQAVSGGLCDALAACRRSAVVWRYVILKNT